MTEGEAIILAILCGIFLLIPVHTWIVCKWLSQMWLTMKATERHVQRSADALTALVNQNGSRR